MQLALLNGPSRRIDSLDAIIVDILDKLTVAYYSSSLICQDKDTQNSILYDHTNHIPVCNMGFLQKFNGTDFGQRQIITHYSHMTVMSLL